MMPILRPLFFTEKLGETVADERFANKLLRSSENRIFEGPVCKFF